MKRILSFGLLLFLVLFASAFAQDTSTADVPEFTSLLSLFSAHALPSGGVRLNWTLEKTSPTIVSFRLYRGYEDVGNFAVLCEVPVHSSGQTLDYSFNDTTALPNVSYFYKVSAAGQSKESVFPVVISATPHLKSENSDKLENLPVIILPGAKLSLYVRRGGHVKLDILSEASKPLVNDSLRPGIYEFEAPKGKLPMTLRIRHDSDYETQVAWPVH
jgi:hypothetical protein